MTDEARKLTTPEASKAPADDDIANAIRIFLENFERDYRGAINARKLNEKRGLRVLSKSPRRVGRLAIWEHKSGN